MKPTMRSAFAVAVAVLSAAVSGCSSSPSLSDMPAQEAAVYCKQVFACCSSTEANDGGLGTTQSACVSTLTSGLSTTQAQAGVNSGRMFYHSDTAQECLNGYAALSCPELKSSTTSNVAACNSYLEPKVAIGGACDQDDECLGGTCPGGTSTQDGVCVAFVSEGAACTSAACGQGLVCNAVSDGGSLCAQLSSDGASCIYNEQCVNGGCNGVLPDGGAGTCGLKGGSGTTCYLTTGCASAGPGDLAWLAVVGVAWLRRTTNPLYRLRERASAQPARLRG